MKKVWVKTLLIFILALGFFFRLNHINEKSLWLDEGITYYNSSGSLIEVWDKTAELDQSPPGYYFVMHGYLEIFGENEFGFRFISVIFGLLSIYFLYLLVQDIYSSEAGLFAAFLLAINPFHIGYSNEARMYVLLPLLSLIGLFLLFRAMKFEKGYRYWFLLILTSAFGLYTHNFYFFVLLGQFFVFIVLLFSGKNKLRKSLNALVSAILVLLLYLPWIPNLMHQLDVNRYWMGENSIWDLKYYLLDFFNGNKYALLGTIFLIVLGIVMQFIKKSKYQQPKIRETAALILFFVLSFGAPLAYSLLFEPILKIRYVIYVIPILLALSGLWIASIKRYFRYFCIPIMLMFFFIWSPWKISQFPREIGEDFRTLANIVEKYPAPLIVHTPSSAHVLKFYLPENLNIKPFPNSDDLREYEIPNELKNDYLKYIENIDSFYLAISHSHEKENGLLEEWSRSACKNEREIEINQIAVHYFGDCNLPI